MQLQIGVRQAEMRHAVVRLQLNGNLKIFDRIAGRIQTLRRMGKAGFAQNVSAIHISQS